MNLDNADEVNDASEISTRLYDAIKKEDIKAINRGLQDFASIGWKMAVIYRFITRKGDKISCVYTKDGNIIFLVNGRFNIDSHKKYIDMFADSNRTKNKSVLYKHFKSREEMNEEELSWIRSLNPNDILELNALHDIIKKS